MLNDILAEDNQTFTQDNYKLNPPEKYSEPKKPGNWGDPKAEPYSRREPAYNKENYGGFGGSDEDNFPAGKRVHYGSQFSNKQPFTNKKKEQTLYPHPDIHFCERRNQDFGKDLKTRKDTVHIYGVDFFSEPELMDFFKEFSPIKVEWINDSSCNVIFPDAEKAANAIFSKTTQSDAHQGELGWRRGLDIEREGKNFNFLIRFATDQDIKDPTTRGAFSKFYKFAKQQSFNKKKHTNKKVTKGKSQKPELVPKKGNTMTLMDRKKTFGKRVIRNNVEVVNDLKMYEQHHPMGRPNHMHNQRHEEEQHRHTFAALNPYQKMGGFH